MEPQNLYFYSSQTHSIINGTHFFIAFTPIQDLAGEEVFQNLPEQREEVAVVTTAGRNVSHLFICLVAKPSVSTP